MAEQKFPRFSERCFFLSPLYSNPGWYYRVRGGHAKGPFYRKEQAVYAAEQYASECSRRSDFGGRHH